MSKKNKPINDVNFDIIDGVKVPRPQKIDKESPARSVAKAISWRIVGSMDTAVVSWFITGKFAWALQIASVEVFTKIILYYLHERAWTNVTWGKRWMKYGLIRRVKLASIKRKRRKRTHFSN